MKMIFVNLLLTQEYFATFTPKQIADVDTITEAAAANGGKADVPSGACRCPK